MYRVYFSRPERGDPLLLAKDVINEAIFRREAAEHALTVREDPDAQEENSVGWVIETEFDQVLQAILTSLAGLGMPLLAVDVPPEEIDAWEADEKLSPHFDFTPNE